MGDVKLEQQKTELFNPLKSELGKLEQSISAWWQVNLGENKKYALQLEKYSYKLEWHWQPKADFDRIVLKLKTDGLISVEDIQKLKTYLSLLESKDYEQSDLDKLREIKPVTSSLRQEAENLRSQIATVTPQLSAEQLKLKQMADDFKNIKEEVLNYKKSHPFLSGFLIHALPKPMKEFFLNNAKKPNTPSTSNNPTLNSLMSFWSTIQTWLDSVYSFWAELIIWLWSFLAMFSPKFKQLVDLREKLQNFWEKLPDNFKNNPSALTQVIDQQFIESVVTQPQNPEVVSENIDKIKPKLSKYLADFFKKKNWNSFDQAKFDQTFDKFWNDFVKGKTKWNVNDIVKKLDQILDWNTKDVNLRSIFEIMWIGAWWVFTFLNVFSKAWFINMWEIWLDWTMETWVNTMVYYSNLLMNLGWLALWNIKLEELIEFVKDEFPLPDDVKAFIKDQALVYIAYKYGWPIYNLVWWTVRVAGEIPMLLVNTPEAISKLAMFKETTFWSWFQNTIKSLEKIEHIVSWSVWTTMARQVWEASRIMIEKLEFVAHYQEFVKLSTAPDNIDDFVKFLEKKWVSPSIMDKFKFTIWFTLNDRVANFVTSWANDISYLFGSIKSVELIKNKFKSNFAIFPQHIVEDIQKSYWSVLTQMWKIIDSRTMLEKVQNLFGFLRLNAWIDIIDVENIWRKAVFIKSAEEFKLFMAQFTEFFKMAPDIARQFIWHIPTLIFWFELDKNIKNALITWQVDGDPKSLIQAISWWSAETFVNFISVVWPINMAYTEYKNGNWEVAWVLWAIGGVETIMIWSFIHKTLKAWNIKDLAKGLVREATIIWRTIDLAKILWNNALLGWRVVEWLLEQIKVVNPARAGKLKWVAWLLAILALTWLTVNEVYKEYKDLEFIRDIAENVKDPEKVLPWIRDNWRQFNKDEKEAVVKVILSWLLSKRYSDIDIAMSFDWNKIKNIDISSIMKYQEEKVDGLSASVITWSHSIESKKNIITTLSGLYNLEENVFEIKTV